MSQIKETAKANGGKFEGSKKSVTETTARNKACSDIRMVTQQAVMIEAAFGHLHDACKANVDATSMVSQPTGNGVMLYRIVTEEEAKEFVVRLANFSRKLPHLDLLYLYTGCIKLRAKGDP